MTDTPNSIVDLYGERPGILIGLTAEYDIVDHDDPEAVIRVRGHRVYLCSAEEADRKIRAAYLQRMGIADPLDMDAS
jgi:hypothetical protein